MNTFILITGYRSTETLYAGRKGATVTKENDAIPFNTRTEARMHGDSTIGKGRYEVEPVSRPILMQRSC